MHYFVKIGDYDIIETTGDILNDMFDLTSELNADRQYIAYYKIDRKKTGTMGWQIRSMSTGTPNHGNLINITIANQSKCTNIKCGCKAKI